MQGNRVQLQQVLHNLITNAIEAMAGGSEPRVLGVKSEIHEGDGVVVSIVDNGTGVDPPDIERIFDPRFTTKTEGMGMGLTICRAIIEAHDGRGLETRGLARAFAPKLEAALTVPVELFDERLSTFEAEIRLRDQGFSAKDRRSRVDAEAAAVILQGWLDRDAR